MAEEKLAPRKDHQSSVHANTASTAHHSNVVAYLSSAFITILAVFSGGAFTAGMSFIGSDLGRAALKNEKWWLIAGYVSFFGLSFALIMLSTLILINYSFQSWNDHREALYKKTNFADTLMKTNGGYWATILSGFSFMFMLMGMTCAVILMLSGGT